MCRFINADEYASTGQGFIGCNMFAYCNNNPILLRDDSGTRPTWCEYDYGNGVIAYNDQDGSLIMLYKEHQKKGSTNPSNREKHEEGQARKKRDKGGEKGDARRTNRSNKRHSDLEPNPQKSSVIKGVTVMVLSAAVIVYLVLNDGTGIGAADDFLIVPAVEAFRRGLQMVGA